MTRIKVAIDRSDPPKERIVQYKNFNNFMRDYQRFHSHKRHDKLWYRDKKKLAYIAIIVALILIWLFAE